MKTIDFLIADIKDRIEEARNAMDVASANRQDIECYRLGGKIEGLEYVLKWLQETQ